MASYHLQVKTIKRSAGRSATAAAAYRSGEAILCQREGRLHDYSRKGGIEETFLVLPEHAPDWAGDRAQLWNEAEARETRRNSVTAREWELALPAELPAAERRALAHDFAEALVARYGIAADVAIHAPHRDGDDRNHHAHILTTTRRLEAEGLTDKTRVLDAAQTGGPEIEAMRATWAEMQNDALERAGELDRVDHRSLADQRVDALAAGNALLAEILDRAPEVKLGPAANAMERRAMRAAERDGHDYEPVTDRGRAVHEARTLRALYDELWAELQARLEAGRESWAEAREEGQGRISAGLAALRAATEAEPGGDRESIRDRLKGIVGRDREAELDGQGEAPERQSRRGRNRILRPDPVWEQEQGRA